MNKEEVNGFGALVAMIYREVHPRAEEVWVLYDKNRVKPANAEEERILNLIVDEAYPYRICVASVDVYDEIARTANDYPLGGAKYHFYQEIPESAVAEIQEVYALGEDTPQSDEHIRKLTTLLRDYCIEFEIPKEEDNAGSGG